MHKLKKTKSEEGYPFSIQSKTKVDCSSFWKANQLLEFGTLCFDSIKFCSESSSLGEVYWNKSGFVCGFRSSVAREICSVIWLASSPAIHESARGLLPFLEFSLQSHQRRLFAQLFSLFPSIWSTQQPWGCSPWNAIHTRRWTICLPRDRCPPWPTAKYLCFQNGFITIPSFLLRTLPRLLTSQIVMYDWRHSSESIFL